MKIPIFIVGVIVKFENPKGKKAIKSSKSINFNFQ